MRREREFYRSRWQGIVEKPFKHFQDMGIETQRLGKVLWIGSPSHSASVGAWINEVHRQLQGHKTLSATRHFFIRCHSHAGSHQDHLYFGFHTLSGGKELIIACGGATDYSGRGGEAKALAEAFMEDVCERSQGVVKILDHEIGYLIEHMLKEG